MIIWQPEQQINNGRFIIQNILGTGGFGITYKALEPSTRKLYAIKTLNSTMQLREDFAEQQVKFINEALTIKGFDHKHILKVYEVIQEGQLFGVVMEYIDGVTLFKYVQNQGQLSENEALLYIDQIGQALEYIHNKGQLHRDIKPENILLRENKQEAVLIDFGLTRSLATKSMTNALTAGFAPIEQYRRKGNFGEHTDVYALAATLYYLLTADGLKKEGEICPVPATNRKYEDEPLPEPKHYNSRISQRVNNAILQGMEIEPGKRTATVLKLRENLGLVRTPPPNPLPVREVRTPLPNPLPAREEGGLKSDVGMDYSKLRDLLQAGKWKEADEETRRVMLAVAKREKEGWLDVEDIDNFPCADLRTIDQLWVKYSDGKFGFSVQKRIYQSLGGTREYNTEIWEKFGGKVGWIKGEKERVESRGIWEKLRNTWSDVWSQPVGSWLYYQNITFDKKAPEGHLPAGVGGMERILGYYQGGVGAIKETDVGWGGGVGYFGRVLKGRGVSLFYRVETCKL
ncbi:serine/threonine kinase [Sphaerospermopsis reniformis]|uniref:Serine/threonine kinase n=1 Tax=Sphaerospermopsis reniformis TaxID=531300 RepID=A0A480A6B2_9CYAN|nr:serine/threonine-protein kinase [Sphaerospermopsis reniformis]GCL39416.1 serine/threonine kinase [Sphaerospermopsis reniformis]